MKKFSGANFCFWVSVSVVFILVLFFLCFCFTIWFVVPGNVSRKFSSGQVRCLHKFSGANFFLWCRCWSVGSFSPFSKGEMLSGFFILCFLCRVRCLLSFFAVLLFLGDLGPLFEKFSGANFCFRVSVLVACFLVLFCQCFCLFCGFLLPTMSRKILLMSGLVFLGFLSSFGFFADVVVFLFFVSFFFLREKAQVVTGHTPARTLCFFPFSCLCPRRNRVYLPFWPCALSFWRFVGVPFLGPGVFGVSLGTSLRPFSRTRGGKGASLLLVLVLFFPFRFVLRLHTFSRSPSRLSSRSGQPE